MWFTQSSMVAGSRTSLRKNIRSWSSTRWKKSRSLSRSSFTMGRRITRVPSFNTPSFWYSAMSLSPLSLALGQALRQVLGQPGRDDALLRGGHIVRDRLVLDGKFLVVEDSVGRFRAAAPGLTHAPRVDKIMPTPFQKDFSRSNGVQGHFAPDILVPQGPAVGVAEEAHPEL